MKIVYKLLRKNYPSHLFLTNIDILDTQHCMCQFNLMFMLFKRGCIIAGCCIIPALEENERIAGVHEELLMIAVAPCVV